MDVASNDLDLLSTVARSLLHPIREIEAEARPLVDHYGQPASEPVIAALGRIVGTSRTVQDALGDLVRGASHDVLEGLAALAPSGTGSSLAGTSAHQFLGVEPAGPAHVGVCSCDWRSGPVEGGWAAGVAWQAHCSTLVPAPVLPARPPGHRSFRIEILKGRLLAVCACGWRSSTSSSAGLAGALWDEHVDELAVAAPAGLALT